ncbi:hypothetical protein ABTX61_09090, partial [Amycolatopsis japonica]
MRPLVDGSPNLIGELAAGTKGISDGCRKIALDIEYAKYSAVGQLFLLAYEIAMEYALASFTGGASLANLTWHYALTRNYLLILFKMLVRAISFEVFIGVTGGLLIDAAVQRLQHERTEWDSAATSGTLVSGVVGGVLGGAVGEVGEKLGRKVGGLLGKDFTSFVSDDLLKLVKDLKLPGGGAVPDEWVRDVGRVLADRAGRQLRDPGSAFTKGAVDAFADVMAGRFAVVFGRDLGDGVAQQLGRDYARSFVDGWSRHGLDGSGVFGERLRGVLGPHEGVLGGDAVGLLTETVPGVLARNVVDRLGGNLAARAAEFSTIFVFEGVSGVMSQAALASINGESVSAGDYAMGFVGGVVGGAVSHKLEGIGGAGLDAAVKSIKASFAGLNDTVTSVPEGLLKNLPHDTTTTTNDIATTPITTTTPATTPNTTSTDTKATPNTDTKTPTPTKTTPETKADLKTTPDLKTASDGKTAKSGSDIKPSSEVKTSSAGKAEAKSAADAGPTAVRTSSDVGAVEDAPPIYEELPPYEAVATSDQITQDEERPQTRPAPLRPASDEQANGSTSEAAASAQVEQTVETASPDVGDRAEEASSEPAPKLELDLGKPFGEDIFDATQTDAVVETTGNATPDTPAGEIAGEEQELVLADLPPFLATGQALGSAPVLSVEGADELRAQIARSVPGIGDEQIDIVIKAVLGDFESALDGLHFPIRTREGWREVRVRAAIVGGLRSEPKEATKADLTVQSGVLNAENLAAFRAGDVGMSATARALVGPYATVGGKVALAAPGVTQAVSVSTMDQRLIRSGEGSRRVSLKVEFSVSVHDENGADIGSPAGEAEVNTVAGRVTVRVPEDLIRIAPPVGQANQELTADVGRKLQNPVPEAVTDLGEVFTGVADLLHPSVTAFGAPGRTVLRAFLSTASLRENFGAMLEGWVSSPALLSKGDGKAEAVRMKAVLTNVKLVGPTTQAQLRLHESATTSSAISAFTKRGFDASIAVGGGAGFRGAKIAAGIGAGYSARSVDTAISGRTSTAKSGIQLNGDIGLYKFDATIVVQVLDGRETSTTATVYARVGMAEAAAQGLPVSEGAGDGITPPITEKFPPSHLSAGLAAGNVRVGELTGAEAVLAKVRAKLRETSQDKKLLPDWGMDKRTPRYPGTVHTLEMLDNEQRLESVLSPLALRNRMDALLGAGVSVTLKRQGVLWHDYVTVHVKLESEPPKHIGRATGRVIRNAVATGPALGVASMMTKGMSIGPEGQVAFGATGTTAVKFGISSGTRAGAGPVTDSSDLNVGSVDSEGFEHKGRFVVSIIGFSRVNATIRQLVPGLPGLQVPDVRQIWSSSTYEADGNALLPASFTVWMSDSLTLPAKSDEVSPGEPQITQLAPPRSITDHLQELPAPTVGDWIGVECIVHTGYVGSAALDALVEASDGDRALALPGSDSWTSVQALLSPENIKAALRSFTHGLVSADLVHSRRLADRVGRVGVHARLSKPTLVRVAYDAGWERNTSGGFRYDTGTSKSKGTAISFGVSATGSTGSDPTSVVTGGLSSKPWAKTTTKADGIDITAVVDRNVTTAAGTPRVLVRFDVDFTVIAEARQQTAVIRPAAKVAARGVSLPGAAMVWLTEAQATEYGLLPAKPAGPRKRDDRLAPPSTLQRGKPSALGLGAVEQLPDLSDLVPKLSAALTKAEVPLLPGASLYDAMNNWSRLNDLVSASGVQGLVDSALDGGIPLHTHLPKLFTSDGYQILLTAKTLGSPTFREVVNDGRTVEHSTIRAVRTIHVDSTAHSWSVALRAGGQKKHANGETAATVGGAVAKGGGAIKVTGTVEAHTEQETLRRTGTGPAALFDVPIEFTLEVRHGGETVASASTGERKLGIRLLADNLTADSNASPAVPDAVDARPDAAEQLTTDEVPGPTPLSELDATPDALAKWRQGSVTKLPDMASVESVRAAAQLREVVRQTLSKAGADSGITGYGTAPTNVLWATLSPQVLQAFLPAMTAKSLPMPALREATVRRGKKADIQVHARLAKPQTIALSDGVNLENPKGSTAARSIEQKVVGVGDMGVTVPTVATVNGTDNIGSQVTGADTRWTSEPTDATVDGTTVSAISNVKPAGRTALVRFDVDYRIVVTVDGRTEVVDVSLPGSADVRMPIAGLTDVTGQKTPRILKARQGRVARTAKAWRDAEVGAAGHRRQAEELVKQLGVDIDWNTTVEAAREQRPGTLEDRHHKYYRETEKALREAEKLAEAAQLEFARVTTELTASTAKAQVKARDLDELADAATYADRTFRVITSELAAAHKRVDLAEENLDLAAALDDVRRLEEERTEAKLRRDLFREVLAEQRAALAETDVEEHRVAAAEQVIRTQAVLQAKWLDFVDSKQDAWWLAKGALDTELARITAPPGSPEDEKWRHSRATDAPWFSVPKPLAPAQWEPLRATTPRRTVVTETADVLTTVLSGKDKRYDGVIRYGVSRFEVAGRGVTEFTVPINLVPGQGVSAEQLEQLRERATAGLEKLINNRYGLPNGDQLHVRVEFTDDRLIGRDGNPRYRAYDVIAGDDERTTQTTWRLDSTPEELAHELLHYLGVGDEEHDENRVFLSQEDDGTTGVVTGDESIMGTAVVTPGKSPKLMPRHAWMIQNVLQSQLGPGYRLGSPGQDTLPGTRTAAYSGLTDIQRDILDQNHLEALEVGGDSLEANLVEAIVRTVAPDSSARQADLREQASSLRHATPEAIADALGVRLEWLAEDGHIVTLGHEAGEPARVVLSASAGFLATTPMRDLDTRQAAKPLPSRPAASAGTTANAAPAPAEPSRAQPEPVTEVMIGAADRTIGTAFPSKEDDKRTARAWARTTATRPVVEYNVLTSAPKKQLDASQSTAPLLEKRPAPWVSKDLDKQPIFLYLNADVGHFQINEVGGEAPKRYSGAEFGKLLLGATGFRQALEGRPDAPIVLLASESGKLNEPGGGGYELRRALRELGYRRTVYAPTATINLVPDNAAINVDNNGEFVEIAEHPDDVSEMAAEVTIPPVGTAVSFAKGSRVLNDASLAEVKRFAVWASTAAQAMLPSGESLPRPWIKVTGHGNAVIGRADTALARAKAVATALKAQLSVADVEVKAVAASENSLPPLISADPAARRRSVTMALVTTDDEDIRSELGLLQGETVKSWLSRTVRKLGEDPGLWASSPLVSYLDEHLPLESAQEKIAVLRLSVDPGRSLPKISQLVGARGQAWVEFLLPNGDQETIAFYSSADGSPSVRFGDTGHTASASYEVSVSAEGVLRALDQALRNLRTAHQALSFNSVHFARGLFERATGSVAPSAGWLIKGPGHLSRQLRKEFGGIGLADHADVLQLSTTVYFPESSDVVDPDVIKDFVQSMAEELLTRPVSEQQIEIVVRHGGDKDLATRRGANLENALRDALRAAPVGHGVELEHWPIVVNYQQDERITGQDGEAFVAFGERIQMDEVPPDVSIQKWLTNLASKSKIEQQRKVAEELGDTYLPYALDQMRLLNPSREVFRFQIRISPVYLATLSTGHAWIEVHDPFGGETALNFFPAVFPMPPWAPVPSVVWADSAYSQKRPSSYIAEYMASANDIMRGLRRVLALSGSPFKLASNNCTTFVQDVYSAVIGAPAPNAGYWIPGPTGLERTLRAAAAHITVRQPEEAFNEPLSKTGAEPEPDESVAAEPSAPPFPTGPTPVASPHRSNQIPAAGIIGAYRAATAKLPYFGLSDTEFETTLAEFSRLVGIGELKPHSPELGDSLTALDNALGELEAQASAAGTLEERTRLMRRAQHVRCLANDAVLVAALAPTRGATFAPLTPQRLRSMLSEVAAILHDGQDPFLAEGSPWRGLDYDQDTPLPRRLVELMLIDTPQVVATTLREDPLFQDLLRNPDALATAIFVASGGIGHAYSAAALDEKAIPPAGTLTRFRREVVLRLRQAGIQNVDPEVFTELAQIEKLGRALENVESSADDLVAVGDGWAGAMQTLTGTDGSLAAVALLLAAPVPADPDVRLVSGGKLRSQARPVGKPWTRDGAMRAWWQATDPAVAVEHRIANPVTWDDINAEHRRSPAATIRSEDGGMSRSGRPWQATIAYDLRTFAVERDGHEPVRVRLHTIRLQLDDTRQASVNIGAFKARVKSAVNEYFNQGYLLPNGEQLMVEVEFTDRDDTHGTVFVTGPGTPADQLHWPSDATEVQFAHELGHFLGLYDEYFVDPKTRDAPVFQNVDGAGRVATGRGLMTASAVTGDVVLEPRNLQLLWDRAHALVGDTPKPARQSPRGSERKPGFVASEVDVQEFYSHQEFARYLEQVPQLLKDHPHLSSVGVAELAAIRAYSHNSTLYSAIDEYLTKGTGPEYAGPLSRLLVSAVTRYPARHTGLATRVMRLSVAEGKEMFKVGEKYADQSVFRAMQGDGIFASNRKVIVRALVHDAAFINWASVRTTEREVLLPPGTTFDVLAVEEVGGKLHVEIRQLSATPTRIGKPFTGFPGEGPDTNPYEDGLILKSVARNAEQLAPDLASGDTRAHRDKVLPARNHATREAGTPRQITVNTWRSATQLDKLQKCKFFTEPTVLVAGGSPGNVKLVIDDAQAAPAGDKVVLPPGSTFEVVEVTRPAEWYQQTEIHLRQTDPLSAVQLAAQDSPHRTVDEQAEIVANVLARGLRARDGDLHLTAVAAMVNQHPDSDLVWYTALKAVVSNPDLAQKIQTITYQRQEGDDVYTLAVPDSVWDLLALPGGPQVQIDDEITEPVEILSSPSAWARLAEVWEQDSSVWDEILDDDANGHDGPDTEDLAIPGFPATRSAAWANVLGARQELSHAEAAHSELLSRLAPGGAGSSRDVERLSDSTSALERARHKVTRAVDDLRAWGNDPGRLDRLFDDWTRASITQRPRSLGGADRPENSVGPLARQTMEFDTQSAALTPAMEGRLRELVETVVQRVQLGGTLTIQIVGRRGNNPSSAAAERRGLERIAAVERRIQTLLHERSADDGVAVVTSMTDEPRRGLLDRRNTPAFQKRRSVHVTAMVQEALDTVDIVVVPANNAPSNTNRNDQVGFGSVEDVVAHLSGAAVSGDGDLFGLLRPSGVPGFLVGHDFSGLSAGRS